MNNLFTRRRPGSPQAASQRAIERQLHSIERQGAGLAFLAHATSFSLVIAFSAGSLVALAGDAFAHFLSEWRGGVVDIPALISFLVSFLLVVCMDVALIVAASAVRMLLQRRQSGLGIHVAVIVGVSLVEAGTYLYMSAIYDHPTSLAVWLLIAARSLSAPLTAVYLSLARVLPIGARDILYQVELVTARGVIGDMTLIASDPTATTERKLALYQASSVMAPDDRARLDDLIAAARVGSPAENTYTAEQAIAAVREQLVIDYPPVIEEPTRTPPEPPDDGGSPTVASKPATATRPLAGNVTPLRRGMGRAPRRDKRTASRANARSGRRGTAEKRIRAALASNPGIGFTDLVTRASVSSATASKWLAVIEAERQASAV